ncbi:MULTISPECIES: bifunctional phosphopantothenoylcysteine decarboxylase/phosphopantothenate--cysteine ligase CoaBC [Lacticaseibacillus]|uniref:bifunctional phosphopantothenoylcysteine decarboxylase/phosphopantothenate--cysteine ligase CoaBC n=1 Tax=Lacticaseibacillus TaxID=2759736 RepID=UPI00063DA13C|nr:MULTISPECIES: bifunctional phosphopantothenoylcysteine decarboxylase/phosphopantothenate--cysteine ligase CoaBC [Lacticaseibacillus]KLI76656.1 DNA/pantothenate metabolism flavoprotein [Lacticaseibacillus casei]
MKKQQIALFVTGGIAAYKTPLLVRALVKAGHDVRVAMTTSAEKFVTPETLAIVSKHAVLTDGHEFDHPEHVAHVALAHWADLGVIVPATANTLAKLAAGMADNVVTTTLLAMAAPKLMVPAMNDQMWQNPQTQHNITRLTEQQGYLLLPPATGQLAEGYVGVGRMPEPDQIALYIESLDEPLLKGRHIIVSAGGTKERLDPVRFLTNDSSGKMGTAIANAAAGAGATVTLVTTKQLPVVPGVTVKPVTSAQSMADAIMIEFEEADAVVMAAAVADYRAPTISDHKLKKADANSGLTLTLVQNPDILATLGQKKTHQLVIGFAAETNDLLANAQVKLTKKKADMIVANAVDATHGFNADTDAVTLLRPNQPPVTLPEMPKQQVAAALVKQLATMLPKQKG